MEERQWTTPLNKADDLSNRSLETATGIPDTVISPDRKLQTTEKTLRARSDVVQSLTFQTVLNHGRNFEQRYQCIVQTLVI